MTVGDDMAGSKRPMKSAEVGRAIFPADIYFTQDCGNARANAITTEGQWRDRLTAELRGRTIGIRAGK